MRSYRERVWSRRQSLLATIVSVSMVCAADAGIFNKLKGNDSASPIKEVIRVSTNAAVQPESGPEPANAPASNEPITAETPVSTVESELGPPADYVIGPGDILSFQSFDDPALSREQVIVLYDGKITLPLIPDINVDGMTREQAEAAVRTAYEKVFRDPQLAINVRGPQSKFYYVLGDIVRPSRYPYESRVSVLEAINTAGGLRITQRSGGESFAATTATLSKAFIIRTGRGPREVIELDLRGLTNKGPHASETMVHPGDVVYIPEGISLVYILGEVRTPSAFQLGEGQTLMHVLAQAGGFVESSAKLRHIVILRAVDQNQSDVMLVDLKQILKTGIDVPLKAGDIIYIPRKDLVKLNEFVTRLTGTISPVLSLYSQLFDAYYAEERNRLLVEAGAGGNDILSVLQAIRSFGGTFQGSLQGLSLLSP